MTLAEFCVRELINISGMAPTTQADEYREFLFVVGFGFLTAVTVKNATFWDIMPCSLVEVSDVLKKPTTSIFRVKELAKQPGTFTSVNSYRQWCHTNYVQNIFVVSSSSGSDASRYVIVTELLDSVFNTWCESKSPY
jgi:hypothetical protein